MHCDVSENTSFVQGVGLFFAASTSLILANATP
jgi:hypothetical protein